MGECIIINRPKIITKIVLPEYSYSGDNLLINDGNGNWRLKFLTSGTLVFNRIPSNLIDVFLVGGGGSGGGQGCGDPELCADVRRGGQDARRGECRAVRPEIGRAHV